MSLLESASLILTPNGYKSGKLYSIVPSSGNGDLTFTRATSASRTNSSGLIETVLTGVPRLDYSGSTPSILLEPQRTNLAAYSTQFNDAYWSKTNSTISSNLITAPDGTTTADKIVSNLVTARISVAKTFTVTANVKNTFTLYAKAAEWSRICIFHDATTFSEGAYYGAGVQIDLLTGISTNSSILKATSVGNGWYRIETSATPTITSHDIEIVPFNPVNTGNVNAVVGDGVSGVYIWGAQFESSASYATSYIPTTTSTVTRNADLASVSGVSSLIGQTEGVMFIESAALANDLTRRVLSISDGTADNRIFIRYEVTSNTISAFGVVGGVSFPNQIMYTLSDETQYAKIALRYRVNDITLWVNGAKRGIDTTSQILPSNLSRLAFDRGDNVDIFYGKVKSAQLYKTYLTDAEMVSLTTL